MSWWWRLNGSVHYEEHYITMNPAFDCKPKRLESWPLLIQCTNSFCRMKINMAWFYSVLLPASEGWGTSCFHKCLSVHGGRRGTSPPSHNTSSSTMSFRGGGYSISIPSHNTSTSPMSFLVGGYPSDWFQVPSGETRVPDRGYRVPCVYPQPGQGWGSLLARPTWGYPSLAQDGDRVLPSEQHSVYSLRSERCASCVHAEGLSCKNYSIF